jgi:hypothetical protein
MRSGVTQLVPTGVPLVTITIGSDVYDNKQTEPFGRLVSLVTDEQLYGSLFTVVLDNSDEALNGKTFKGSEVTINLAFTTQTGSDLPPLYVFDQQFTSEQGKLTVTLTIIDGWGLLNLASVNFSGSYYNQPWQESTELAKRKLPNGELIDSSSTLFTELAANYDLYTYQIVADIISTAIGKTVATGDRNLDTNFSSLKPALTVSSPISAVKQLMEMTYSYLVWKNVGGVGQFYPIKPTAHSSVYTFNTLNTFWSEASAQSVVTPNTIYVWAYDSTDTTQWICNTTVRNAASYSAIGEVPRHIFLADLDSNGTSSTQANLTAIAQGYLSKVEGSLSVGVIIAPMHCSLELLDTVTLSDNRYTTPLTVTGYVTRMERVYKSGEYKIKITLGGAATGFVPSGGSTPVGLAELETPAPPVWQPEIPPAYELPKAIQGYTTNLKFWGDSQRVVSWDDGEGDDGLITFYDKSTLTVSTGSTGTKTAGTIYYIWFDLDAANPSVLKVGTVSQWKAAVDEKVGLLCMVQMGSDANTLPTIIPSYGKEPLITCDVIHMNSLAEYDYGDGKKLPVVYTTEIYAGHLKLTANTQVDTTEAWYHKSGVVIDAAYGISLYGNNALRTFASVNDYKAGTPIQCKLDTAGKISAGQGNVLLGYEGMIIKSDNVLQIYSGTTKIGKLYNGSTQFGFIGENNIGIYSCAFGSGDNTLCCGSTGTLIIGTSTLNGSTINVTSKISISGTTTIFGSNTVSFNGGKFVLPNDFRVESSGCMFYDGLNKHVKFWNGSAWIQLAEV